MPPFKSALVAGAILFLTAPAIAQTPGQRLVIENAGSARQEGLVRVQTNINFFLAGPTGDGEEAQKLRDKARRIVYEMAAHECDLLRELLAKDCKMESLNTNIGRQFGQQQQEGLTINGSMSFQIWLK